MARDRVRPSEDRPAWYRLRCPGTCPVGLVKGADEAARMISQHVSVCPTPGPSVRPVAGGATIRPLVYADRVIR